MGSSTSRPIRLVLLVIASSEVVCCKYMFNCHTLHACTSEWSTILLPTQVRLISEVQRHFVNILFVLICKFLRYRNHFSCSSKLVAHVDFVLDHSFYQQATSWQWYDKSNKIFTRFCCDILFCTYITVPDRIMLIHLPLVAHICFRESDEHWFR